MSNWTGPSAALPFQVPTNSAGTVADAEPAETVLVADAEPGGVVVVVLVALVVVVVLVLAHGTSVDGTAPG